LEKEDLKKNVLIIGSSGMLGHQVYRRFKINEHKYNVWDITRSMPRSEDSIVLDVMDKPKLEETILRLKPDFIINCVGILISKSNSDISNAIYVNSYLPHQLAKTCSLINSKLIHISTDCVFSGEKGQYRELDEKDGKDNYAKTKALGEVDYGQHLTIRTSIIGPELKEHGEGLLHWFLNQKEDVNGFANAIWSGVTTYELARFIEQVIHDDLSGIYHVTNNQSINKHELLKLFAEHFKKDVQINKVPGKNVDKSFLDTRKETEYEVPGYGEMVQEMAKDVAANYTEYAHYNLPL
jgi:dTDP-4-dehydrorhamnose reductase